MTCVFSLPSTIDRHRLISAVFFFLRKHDKISFSEITVIKNAEKVIIILRPEYDAVVLVHGICVVDAVMILLRTGDNDVAPSDGIYCVLYRKGHVSRNVDIYLAALVGVAGDFPCVVSRGKLDIVYPALYAVDRVKQCGRTVVPVFHCAGTSGRSFLC